MEVFVDIGPTTSPPIPLLWQEEVQVEPYLLFLGSTNQYAGLEREKDISFKATKLCN